MCKVFTLTNTSKIKNIDKAVNTILSKLSDYERDGLGYTISGESGIYGERSVHVLEFNTSFKAPIHSMPFTTSVYNRFGLKSKPVGAGMFHGRTSTNHKNLLNTHPINKHGWSLIHNGVVTNHGPEHQMNTTNDTEHLVEYMGTKGIQSIEKHISGYYAFTALDPMGQLHVVKDSIANLYFARISTIDSFVFATTKALIKDICTEMKWKHSIIETMNDNQHLIFKGNDLVSMNSISPRGATMNETQYAEKSLGRKIDQTEGWSGPSFDLAKYSDDADSLNLFLQEVETQADRSYMFLDYQGNKMTLEEFQDLEQEEKIYCTVVRPDGTIVDPDDYHTDKLYQGSVFEDVNDWNDNVKYAFNR